MKIIKIIKLSILSLAMAWVLMPTVTQADLPIVPYILIPHELDYNDYLLLDNQEGPVEITYTQSNQEVVVGPLELSSTLHIMQVPKSTQGPVQIILEPSPVLVSVEKNDQGGFTVNLPEIPSNHRLKLFIDDGTAIKLASGSQLILTGTTFKGVINSNEGGDPQFEINLAPNAEIVPVGDNGKVYFESEMSGLNLKTTGVEASEEEGEGEGEGGEGEEEGSTTHDTVDDGPAAEGSSGCTMNPALAGTGVSPVLILLVLAFGFGMNRFRKNRK